MYYRIRFRRENVLRVKERSRKLKRKPCYSYVVKYVKRDEATGGCRKLSNDELHDLNSSLNIIRMIKSLMMR
jgi:hypothetical protein